MEFAQIYFKHSKKLAIITNLLAFFLFLFEQFSLLEPDPGGEGKKADPDPRGKMNADPDPQP